MSDAKIIRTAAEVLVHEQSSGCCQLDKECSLCDCGRVGPDLYALDHAAKVVAAVEPLIREQIANELKRNRPGHGGTEWRSGYRAGYDDAIAQVEHGGDHHG